MSTASQGIDAIRHLKTMHLDLAPDHRYLPMFVGLSQQAVEHEGEVHATCSPPSCGTLTHLEYRGYVRVSGPRHTARGQRSAKQKLRRLLHRLLVRSRLD